MDQPPPDLRLQQVESELEEEMRRQRALQLRALGLEPPGAGGDMAPVTGSEEEGKWMEMGSLIFKGNLGGNFARYHQISHM